MRVVIEKIDVDMDDISEYFMQLVLMKLSPCKIYFFGIYCNQYIYHDLSEHGENPRLHPCNCKPLLCGKARSFLSGSFSFVFSSRQGSRSTRNAPDEGAFFSYTRMPAESHI